MSDVVYPMQYTPFAEYERLFSRIKLSRTDDGILTVRLHKDDAEFSWNFTAHREVALLWNLIGLDPENKVIILTGTGEEFLVKSDFEPIRSGMTPYAWGLVQQDGRKILADLVEIEQPIIAVLNGPVHIHSQIPLLCDIILSAPDAMISDNHIPRVIPGDGHHVVWPLMFGLNRSKYLLLTQGSISPEEAKGYGVVSEILARDRLLDRAQELAREFIKMDPLVLRQIRPVMMQTVKKLLLENVSHGLQAEGYGLVKKLSDG